MKGLSPATWDLVQRMFPAKEQAQAAGLLVDECGNNLPFMENETEEGLERIRFAVLKLSRGKMEKLGYWVEYTQLDWRDTLMAAGFGNWLFAHQIWYWLQRLRHIAFK